MPVVNSCAAEACAYNREQTCHALAITVGDSRSAQCDTFFGAAMKGGDPSSIGHVGACKKADCMHNIDLECQAPGIVVGYRESEVDCLTYQPI
ncbi:DUF1540 domain-containing protein [Actinopolymorpha alba]|uniref:DUF1540 domain-containing protein n=1 Tax=Actinopolymorpha alba TaxID=533267 RepID=UPI00192B34DF|nr:DUF1540 domain-containing protein [Actinopolymorpha alba]